MVIALQLPILLPANIINLVKAANQLLILIMKRVSTLNFFHSKNDE